MILGEAQSVELPIGFNQLSFDEFTWSDNTRASSANAVLVSIPVSSSQLIRLSKLVYQKYLEVVKDVPTYFDEWDEPFPKNENDVFWDPEKLVDYFKKSSLWSDFLIDKISTIQGWNFSLSQYHVLRVERVRTIDSTLRLFMYAKKLNM